VIGQTSNLAINPALYAKLPYDPLRDLSPVALLVSAPVVLVVNANSKYQSFADLIAAAKGDPGAITYASPGNGTVSHLAGELLQRAAGVKLTHVPYKGAAQALSDTLGGQVQSFMSSVPSALAQVKGGRLRAIAVTSARRSPELPAVPTVAESGYPGFEANTWYGLLVPAGTPAPIIALLNAEVNRVLAMPEVRARLASEGGDTLGGSPERFAAFLAAEHAKWGRVVRESGAKVD
jgi:tripartite-type tricarboxylate transporter receptor subunit TctC